MTTPDTGRAVAGAVILLIVTVRVFAVLRRRPRDSSGRFVWDKPDRDFPLVLSLRVLLVLLLAAVVAFLVDNMR